MRSNHPHPGPALLRGTRLLAVAAERPGRSLPNADLPAALGTSDRWIRDRTGIETRGIAGDDESVIDLATAAGAKALAGAGVDAGEIDLLLLASCSLPSQIPGAAPAVASRLGLTGGAIDVNAACAGFCYALGVGADAVRVGTAGNVLVIGAERMTDWLDWTDRGTAILFGDGAGAAVVGRADPATDGAADGIGPVVWGSDGASRDLIRVPDFERHLEMDGSAVFRWATTSMAAVARDACARAGIEVSDLAGFVPHQANARIVTALVRQLRLHPETVVADDVTRSGNTSAASVPMAFARLIETGRIASGEPVLLLAFGAGLSWAGQVVRCP